jgi:hypothetical protein
MIETKDFTLKTGGMLVVDKRKVYFMHRLYWRSEIKYYDLIDFLGKRIRDVLIRNKLGNAGWELDNIEFESTLSDQKIAELISQFINSTKKKGLNNEQ